LATIDFKVLKSQEDWDTETASKPTAEKSPVIKATTAEAERDIRTASYHCDAEEAPAPTQSADDHDQRSYPSK
jgi:hypothetical protein